MTNIRGTTPDVFLENTVDQYQTIQPLPLLPLFPAAPFQSQQQRPGFAPVGTAPCFDDNDSFSSSIISVNNTTINPGILPVIVVTTSPYLATPTDVVIGVNNTGLVPFSVVLPANPVTGKFYVVKDVSGTAAAFNITVTAVGHTIDGAASAIINTNFGSITLLFNGVNWSII